MKSVDIDLSCVEIKLFIGYNGIAGIYRTPRLYSNIKNGMIFLKK